MSIEGAGDRGLCAGGDVRAIREAVLTGTGDVLAFWADEYALNATIHHYPKPYVAFMDGVVMGGGVGISAYGSLRLVTERSRVAMPETAIGFFPDVGALHLLSRAPGELGTHLALTGVARRRCRRGRPGPGRRPRGPCRPARDPRGAGRRGRAGGRRCPAPGGGARSCHDTGGGSTTATPATTPSWSSRRCTPTALPRPGRPRPCWPSGPRCRSPSRSKPSAGRPAWRTLEQVLDQDRVLGASLMGSADFVEGVRAVLVDRDHAPRWRHASLEEVSREEVEDAFRAAGPAAAAGVTP